MRLKDIEDFNHECYPRGTCRRGLLKFPHKLFGVSESGRGSRPFKKLKIYRPDRKLLPTRPISKKNSLLLHSSRPLRASSVLSRYFLPAGAFAGSLWKRRAAEAGGGVQPYPRQAPPASSGEGGRRPSGGRGGFVGRGNQWWPLPRE